MKFLPEMGAELKFGTHSHMGLQFHLKYVHEFGVKGFTVHLRHTNGRT
jgi:hypothetical protein